MYTNLYKHGKKSDEIAGNRLKCIYLPFIRKYAVKLFYSRLKKLTAVHHIELYRQ